MAPWWPLRIDPAQLAAAIRTAEQATGQGRARVRVRVMVRGRVRVRVRVKLAAAISTAEQAGVETTYYVSNHPT